MIKTAKGKSIYTEYEKGYQQGIADEHNRIVDIIKSMQETAQAMAWVEYDFACEKILKAIEKEQGSISKMEQVE